MQIVEMNKAQDTILIHEQEQKAGCNGFRKSDALVSPPRI